MSKYKVSEPSALKFLKANGAVVDENENVVNDATDYWKKVYDQAEPKVAKYLHANGTIDENPGSGAGVNLEDNKEIEITENGEIEITPSAGKDGMKKVTATVNVSGGADLENNKEVTIDVSTYTEPVEITPTQGKDGMKKATVTLSNIPSVGTPELKSFKYNETAGGVNIGDTLSLQLVEGQANIALSSDKSAWLGGGFTTIPLTSLLNGETVDVSIKTGPGAITITLSYDGNVNGIVTGTVKAKATNYYGTEWYLGAYQIVSV